MSFLPSPPPSPPRCLAAVTLRIRIDLRKSDPSTRQRIGHLESIDKNAPTKEEEAAFQAECLEILRRENEKLAREKEEKRWEDLEKGMRGVVLEG